jgi:hypothetical protein
MKEEEKINSEFLEKWEKESYEKSWKDGRKELIGKAEKIIEKYAGRVIPNEMMLKLLALINKDLENLKRGQK